MSLKYYLAKLFNKIQIPTIKNSKIHKTSRIGSQSNFYHSDLDSNSYIGSRCNVIHTKIGKFCSISDLVLIGGAEHPISWLSTSSYFYTNNKKNNRLNYKSYKQTTIKNDVWIGQGVIIKAGITINNGVIIGAGSVVTKNVPSYEIWAGSPAKKIGTRFNNDEIKIIEESQWWNYKQKEIDLLSKVCNDKSKFLTFLRTREDE